MKFLGFFYWEINFSLIEIGDYSACHSGKIFLTDCDYLIVELKYNLLSAMYVQSCVLHHGEEICNFFHYFLFVYKKVVHFVCRLPNFLSSTTCSTCWANHGIVLSYLGTALILSLIIRTIDVTYQWEISLIHWRNIMMRKLWQGNYSSWTEIAEIWCTLVNCFFFLKRIIHH